MRHNDKTLPGDEHAETAVTGADDAPRADDLDRRHLGATLHLVEQLRHVINRRRHCRRSNQKRDIAPRIQPLQSLREQPR